MQKVDLVKCVIDGCVAYCLLNPSITKKETIGFLGTITSLLSSYVMWK